MTADDARRASDPIERRLAARRPDPALDALFGAEAHHELRRLAAGARRRRGGARVLILPGIMGSTLGTRRAGRENVLWFDPIEIALGRLTRLALPSKRRFEALGVLLYTYLRLALALRAGGFGADFHPYDWRMSVADAGRDLAARIGREGRAPVHLVAHSVGGLGARALLPPPQGRSGCPAATRPGANRGARRQHCCGRPTMPHHSHPSRCTRHGRPS